MADDDATEQLKQAFLKACGATGSLEAAKAAAKALGDEPLASVRAKNGGSALHLAAFAGQLNTAQWLVERGVPVTGADGGPAAACFEPLVTVDHQLPSLTSYKVDWSSFIIFVRLLDPAFALPALKRVVIITKTKQVPIETRCV